MKATSALILVVLISLAGAAYASRNFNSSSSQYAALQSAAVTNYPATLAAWVNRHSTGSTHAIVVVQDKSATMRMGIFGLTGGGFQADVDPTNSTFGFAAISPATYPSNTWIHVCQVLESATSRKLFVNGVQVASNTVSAVFNAAASLNVTYVGTRGGASGVLGLFMSGQVSDAAVWAVALTAGQVLALASGADPRIVSSTPPTFYAPMWGEAAPEINLVGTAISLSNSPAAGSAGPQVYRP